MGKNPIPSLNWFPADWLASEAHATMSLEQQGAYLNLLSHAWLMDPPCTLPRDDRVLAALSGLGSRWETEGPAVLQQFAQNGERLLNKKLFGIFQIAMKLRKAKIEAGKAGGRKSAISRRELSKQCLSSASAELKLPTSTSTSTSLKKIQIGSSLRSEPSAQRNETDAAPIETKASAEVAKPPENEPLDPELETALRKTSHLHPLAIPAISTWWRKLLEIYEPVAELYVFDELVSADLWLDEHPDRKPRSLRGLQAYFRNWLRRAETNARKIAAGLSATRRFHAPKTNYGRR